MEKNPFRPYLSESIHMLSGQSRRFRESRGRNFPARAEGSRTNHCPSRQAGNPGSYISQRCYSLKTRSPREGSQILTLPLGEFGEDGDRVFTRSQIKSPLAGKKRYLWGEEDGSGDPIRLTFAAYYRRFVYDHDYSRAKEVTYNSDTLSSENLINNIPESHPSAIIVEYHFSGFQAKYGGMDWKSLWLVFEKDGSEWYSVGIAHGE